MAQVTLPDVRISHLAASGDVLVATGVTDTGILVTVLNAGDLAVRRSIPTGTAGEPPWSAGLLGPHLYVPLVRTGTDGSEASSTVLVVDTETGLVTDRDVGAESPYLVSVVGQDVWIAHTFTNSGFGPLGSYRTVSRLGRAGDGATHAVDDAGIGQILGPAGPGRVRVLLIEDAAGNDATAVGVYDSDPWREVSRVSLGEPPYQAAYVAGGFVSPGAA